MGNSSGPSFSSHSCSCNNKCGKSKDGKHCWINAGFHTIVMVCKYCDKEKDCKCGGKCSGGCGDCKK
jgi:hypothetical protein